MSLYADNDLKQSCTDDALNTDSPSSVSFELLEAPLLALGKADSIIQVLPPALRFWEKLGLAPRAGKKDVAAFVFFEEQTGERENEVTHWLDRVSNAYTVSIL